MPNVESELALLRHPRLAILATRPWPAWLWSIDASRLLWANAAGGALFGATDMGACGKLRFDVNDLRSVQIGRLAATLPAAAQERLERLRGFGAGIGRPLLCACSRIVLPRGGAAVLVAAAEPAGSLLPLGERVRHLFGPGDQAVFAADGTLLYASEAALARLGGATTLSALGLDAAAAEALATGDASSVATDGKGGVAVTIRRLGENASRVLVLDLRPQPLQTSAEPDATAQAGSKNIVPDKIESQPVAPEPDALADAPVSAPALAPPSDESTTPRRHPLRFVWQMDADGHFAVGSDEFIELVGPQITAAFGRLWGEIAAELKLDPDDLVSRAVATHETWSGVIVSWPVAESDERLPVELSGLPMFDRDRVFRGYRGFGVCRDIARINQLVRARRDRPHTFASMREEPRSAGAGVSPAVPPDAEPVRAAGIAASDSTALFQSMPRTDRPTPSLAPAANVVQFRPGPPAETKGPSLSPVERKAFRELAQELTARLRATPPAPAAAESALGAEIAPGAIPADAAAETMNADRPPPHPSTAVEQMLLDRIATGVLVYRNDSLLYANRHFLEWSGYENLDALAAAGGLDSLFVETESAALADSSAARPLSIMTRRGDLLAVEGRLFTVPWQGASALALVLTTGQAEERGAAESTRAAAESERREVKSILDAAMDGVLVLDRGARILTANAGAHALFGIAAGDFVGRSLLDLLAPQSEPAARDYLDRIARNANSSHDALDVELHLKQDRSVMLAMTLARLGDDRVCAIFHDATARKAIEAQLRIAKSETQQAVAAKADFLAKVSHEIRTPLNAMIGFAEVIMAERFGAIGNERYREYLKDIHAAGTHMVSLLNDLVDLSKVETGQLDLTFTDVHLNDVTQQCVSIMQAQANRARIIIRTSLTQGLPRVLADERSLRQIALNLLANAIKFVGPGGQVIVSTALSDGGEAVLRVRDTGVGMSEKDIEAALEPFRQTATSGSWGSGGTGLGLPLTKALAEANRANFSIKSAPNAGSLIEIAFPPASVVRQ